jgi:heat shock protein HslJ
MEKLMKGLLAPLVLSLLGVLALSACGAGTPANTPTPTGAPGSDAAGSPLAGTAWVLATLNGQPPVPDTQITLSFDVTDLAGSDGCNRYRSSYQAVGDTIRIAENLMGTMMACPEPVMQQASGYQAALKGVATFKVDGQQLTLFDAAGASLATFDAQSTELAGTSWTVTGFNNGKQAVVSVLNGTTLSMEFAGGQLGGSTGCNSFDTTYQVSGDSLTIASAAATAKLCPEPAGVMDQEAQFLQALATAATYRVEGDTLEIRTADGAIAVTATRAS